MSNNTSSIVSKVRSFCNPLRDAGVGYRDFYLLTFTIIGNKYFKPHTANGNIKTVNSKKSIQRLVNKIIVWTT